ncbi:MAG: serine protease [Ignavibacteria bacterium]|jgi:S1-C subfamily serine protease|nr:serine protease [Ignavibacteria bacterium]
MRIKSQTIMLVVALIATTNCFTGCGGTSPKQQKIYYDINWYVVSDSSAAEYYRIVTLDKDRSSIGKVSDYFITGELQTEIDNAIYIDKKDDKKSIWRGKEKHFNKSEDITELTYYDAMGEKYKQITYYTNSGTPSAEYYIDKDGNRNGECKDYKTNGSYTQRNYKNGVPSPYYLDCYKRGQCVSVFHDNFNSTNVGWLFTNSKIVQDAGLLMTATDEYIASGYIDLEDFDFSYNFRMGANFNFIKKGNTESNNFYGIRWGIKGNNYNAFVINQSGAYRIYTVTNGKSNVVSEGKADVNKTNTLSILRADSVRRDSYLYFLINDEEVDSAKYSRFSEGNRIGVFTNDGEVLVSELEVRQSEDITNKKHILKDWEGSGSGFFVDKRGYIITNYHVIEDAREIEVEFVRNGEKQKYTATVKGRAPEKDLALLLIDTTKSKKQFVPFAKIPYNFKTDESRLAERVFTLGFPGPVPNVLNHTDGAIRALADFRNNTDYYTVTAIINSGNSGGPLFDDKGNLIGVNSKSINREFIERVEIGDTIISNRPYAAFDGLYGSIKSTVVKEFIDTRSAQSLELPNDRTLEEVTDRATQVEALTPYVVWIRVKY